MNALLHWLTAPEWSQVVKTLLHSLWQGALIAAALVLIMRRLANPYARHRCSLVALATIPIAGIITWAILNAINHQPLPVPLPIATEAAIPPELVSLNQSPVTRLIVFADHTPAPQQSRWTACLALAWLVGAMAMLGRAGVKVAGAERLRRACRPLDHSQIAQLVTEARRAIGLARQIRVAVTDKLTSPAVVGVLVPTLILPLTLVTTLTPEQIRFILLHELAHIRRGDYFANLFQLFVEALLFFNPAVWWISHQVRREREACCDALAIELSGAPADYARTLIHVAENVLSPTPAGATAFGGDREPSSLADRIQRLLVPGYRPSLRLTWRAIIGAFVLGAALLVLSAEGTRVAVAKLTKSPSQSTYQKETSSQESKPKLEIASHSSENLNAFKPTSWPLDSDKRTLSGPENLDGMTDWQADEANMLPLPALRLNRVPSAALSNKVPFLFDLPWVGKLFTSSQSKSVKTDFIQLSQLSTLSEDVRNEHNITDSLSIRFQDTTAGNDLVLAQLDRQNDRLAANDNDVTEMLSRIGESATTNRNIHSNAPPSVVPGKLIYKSEKRRAIMNKLNQVQLKRVSFDAMPLSNVVHSLAEEVKQRDPEGSGVNIVINPNTPSPDDGRVVDIGGTRITLKPPLTNVRLMDALDAILKSADKPLKLSIQEYGVAISLRGKDEPTPLFMREFKVKPTLFSIWLAENGFPITEPSGTTNSTHIAESIRGFLAKARIDLEATKAKSIYYDDKNGNLLVRATKEELDQVETLLQPILSQSQASSGSSVQANSPSLLVRSYLVDPIVIRQGLERAIPGSIAKTNLDETVRTFLFTLGVAPKSVFFNERKGELVVQANKEELDIIESILQVLNRPIPQINVKVRFVEIEPGSESDWYFATIGNQFNTRSSSSAAAITTNSSAGSPSFMGVLTAPQHRVALQALTERNNLSLLSEGEVTTLSGRQAQIQTVEMRTIVNGVDLPTLGPGPRLPNNDPTNSLYQPQVLPFGAVLDVIPTVSADGCTIQLTVVPTVTEFLGYDDPGKALPKLQAGSNDVFVLPLPRMRLRQVTTSAVVWDGQTLVLGIANDQIITKQADGGLLEETNPDAEKKQLLIFITATIVDPAGNRSNVNSLSRPQRW